MTDAGDAGSDYDPRYALGHSAQEVRRLELQSRIFAPATERMLRAAGLEPGMSVLDIGTGAGDVAMQAARLVGPSGSVVGLDREASVLEHARSRAEAAGLRQIRYEAGPLDASGDRQRFDFVMGRYVLSHQPDRIAFLRQAAGLVRPGGTLLFIELSVPESQKPGTLIDHPPSRPPVPLYDEVIQHVVAAFGLSGTRLQTGAELVGLFLGSDLPEPEILHEVATGGPSSQIAEWICLTLQTLLPVLEQHGITTADRIGIDTLPTRIQAAVSEARSQIRGSDLVAGWARIG